jgi:hypothetical protein
MRRLSLAIYPILLSPVLSAQMENQHMRVNLDGYHYPPLAASAHIQGDVTFEVSAFGQSLRSGHRLLVQSAKDNLKTWSLPPLQSGTYVIN